MPYDEEAKRLAREYVDATRASTYCAHCGGQPIEWHHDDHLTNENQRVARLTALGFPIERIRQEIEKCTPLCRSCHMREDGRLEALQAARPYQKDYSAPPKPCINCGKPAKPLRKGLCNACNHRKRAGKLDI